MVLDHGTLKLPDGRVFIGDFSMSHKENLTYTYYEIVTGVFIPFTKEPMLFYGLISYGSTLHSTGFENSITPMYNPEDRVWAVENFYKDELTVTDPNPVSGEYSTC